jgi:hypothetical protein
MPNPLLPSAVLRKHYVIYLSESEREQIRAKAEAVKLSVSTFVRMAALGLPVQTPPSDVSVRRWRELARTTANLNQLSLSLNSRRATGVDPVVIDELAEQVRLLRLELLGGKEVGSRSQI